MNKIIVLGDFHFSSRGVSTRLDNYAETCLAKLDFVCEYAFQNKIQTIIMTGDVLHTGDNSTEFINKLIAKLKFYHKEKFLFFYTVVGNHDLKTTDPATWVEP